VLIRRYRARIADIVQERIDTYCIVEPDFEAVWRSIIWRLEAGHADRAMREHREGRYNVTMIHSPRFPVLVLYLLFPESGVVEVYDVTFHAQH